MSVRKKWTAWHDEALIELWSIRANRVEDIGRTLNFSIGAISRHAKRLGLPARCGEGAVEPFVYVQPPATRQFETTVWPDGWSIKQPTREQLMRGKQ